MQMLDFPSIPLMESVVRILTPTSPVTKWTLEPRAVRFTYRGTRYRVGLVSSGILVEEVNDGMLSSGPKADKMYAKLKGMVK